MPDHLTSAAAPVTRLRPDFRPTAILARTDKSLLLAGACADGPAVAKLLTSPDPRWAERFRTEIDAYRTFATSPPPVPVPALIAADRRHHVLVVARVPGRSPARDRFPPQALDPAHLTALLTAVTDLGRWRPPAGAFPHTLDHRARLDRDHRQGLTSTAEHRALTELFHQTSGELRPGHGDPLPGNVLVRPDGRATLIDWEHAGPHLPGHDLAMLWITLAATPEARPRIEERMAAEPPSGQAAFTLNRALLLLRELRTHRAVPPAPWRDARLAALNRDWQDVRGVLRAG